MLSFSVMCDVFSVGHYCLNVSQSSYGTLTFKDNSLYYISPEIEIGRTQFGTKYVHCASKVIKTCIK